MRTTTDTLALTRTLSATKEGAAKVVLGVPGAGRPFPRLEFVTQVAPLEYRSGGLSCDYVILLFFFLCEMKFVCGVSQNGQFPVIMCTLDYYYCREASVMSVCWLAEERKKA